MININNSTLIVGEPWVRAEQGNDNANTVMVGDPWSSLKSSQKVEDNNNIVIVGEPWSTLTRKNSSNGSNGAPAVVAKFNPGKVATPDERNLQVRKSLDKKLAVKDLQSRVGKWMKAEMIESKTLRHHSSHHSTHKSDHSMAFMHSQNVHQLSAISVY